MSAESLFYASLSGDKKYFVSNFLSYFAGLTDNGIVSNKGSSLAVVPAKNMTVKIQNGILVDRGNMARVFGDGEEIVVANADGALTRIDRIVMRNSVTNRNFKPVYVKGTAAAAPVAPAPIRDGDSCDYVLCTITIPKGTTAITAAMIKDERQNKALCGIVFGLGQAVDTTSLFAQFEAIQADKLAEFNRWFEDVKAQLGSDVAGNLLNLIEGLKTETARIDNAKADSLTYNQTGLQLTSKGRSIGSRVTVDSDTVMVGGKLLKYAPRQNDFAPSLLGTYSATGTDVLSTDCVFDDKYLYVVKRNSTDTSSCICKLDKFSLALIRESTPEFRLLDGMKIDGQYLYINKYTGSSYELVCYNTSTLTRVSTYDTGSENLSTLIVPIGYTVIHAGNYRKILTLEKITLIKKSEIEDNILHFNSLLCTEKYIYFYCPNSTIKSYNNRETLALAATSQRASTFSAIAVSEKYLYAFDFGTKKMCSFDATTLALIKEASLPVNAPVPSSSSYVKIVVDKYVYLCFTSLENTYTSHIYAYDKNTLTFISTISQQGGDPTQFLIATESSLCWARTTYTDAYTGGRNRQEKIELIDKELSAFGKHHIGTFSVPNYSFDRLSPAGKDNFIYATTTKIESYAVSKGLTYFEI